MGRVIISNKTDLPLTTVMGVVGRVIGGGKISGSRDTSHHPPLTLFTVNGKEGHYSVRVTLGRSSETFTVEKFLRKRGITKSRV